MWALIIFIVMALSILVVIELKERNKQKPSNTNSHPEKTSAHITPDSCCGEHLVCQKQTLLNTADQIIYYDDEELDELAGIEPDDYTDRQYQAINNVFITLREDDVAGWCRSMQMRGISLPADIREQALLIVKELRVK